MEASELGVLPAAFGVGALDDKLSQRISGGNP
jgi:hypothetical protein